jgi:hypothetical protein
MKEKRGGRIQDEGKERRKDKKCAKREEEGYRMREKMGGRIQDEGKREEEEYVE